jgi:uncharacterized sporulation protein YeaH/YhbH (DUF444 family)
MQVFFEDLALHLARTTSPRRPNTRRTAPASPATARPQPARGALHARRAGPAHRAGRRAPPRAAALEEKRSLLRQPKPIRRHEIPELEREIAACARGSSHPFLDPIDLRYRSRVRVPVPTSRR